MSEEINLSAKKKGETQSPDLVPINERVLKLEIALGAAEQRICTLQKEKPLWRDRKFLSGLFALPALIASGWILTAINSVILKTPYFQPLPFIHTALGTEEAVKAYVAPEKANRAGVVDEIKSLFENNFVSRDALSEMDLVSALDLDQRGYLDRGGLRVAAEDGEIDGHIRYVGGRRQNFNDFFVQKLGLSTPSLARSDCEDVPSGSDYLEINDDVGNVCFVVGAAFRFSDEFTLLRPKDVSKIVFELFVVSQKMTGFDGDGLTGEALFIDESIRDNFFDLSVNAEQSIIQRQGVESDFAEGVIAYKYQAEVQLDEEMEDRTYDILTISLNLIQYDSKFGSERRDKAFTVFVVPKFENS